MPTVYIGAQWLTGTAAILSTPSPNLQTITLKRNDWLVGPIVCVHWDSSIIRCCCLIGVFVVGERAYHVQCNGVAGPISALNGPWVCSPLRHQHEKMLPTRTSGKNEDLPIHRKRGKRVALWGPLSLHSLLRRWCKCRCSLHINSEQIRLHKLYCWKKTEHVFK